MLERHASIARIVMMTALVLAGVARGESITVSAAISLKDAITDAGAAYERSTGNAINLNFGSSGQLLAQIRSGAPVDVFISAADRQIDEAQSAGLIIPDTRRVIARGALVLIVPARSNTSLKGFADLKGAGIGRLAIGQPRTVPAGEYAMQTLDHLHLLHALGPHLVYAASVRQVLDYVERGEVGAGIVYRTDAIQSAKVRVVGIADPSWHRPIVYPAAVVAASRKRVPALQFLSFLGSGQGRAILMARGFTEAADGALQNPGAARAEQAPRLHGDGASGAELSPAPSSASGLDSIEATHGTGSLWPPLLLSLRVALVATALATLIGVPLAFLLARRRSGGRSILEAALIVPLVLPPTVVGYLILITAGAASPVGGVLDRSIGYSILFNWHGAVVAAALVSLPLLYLPAKAAFASVDREMEDVARLMGANLLQTFWHVSLPIARRGIASGMLLAFARALGEFGATVMVMGDRPHSRTLPISIYNDYVSGDLPHAAPAVLTLSAISLAVVLLYNRSWFSRS